MEKQSGRFNVSNMRIPQRWIRWRNTAPRFRRRAETWLGFGAQQCKRTHANLERHGVTANMKSLVDKLWYCASMSFPSVPVHTLFQGVTNSE